MLPSSLPPSPLRHSPSRKHKAYSPYHQSAPHFHRKCGALFGIVGARRGMFSFDTKREPEKCIARCGESFCLPSACKDAPLGQRQGGVFRLPPPYLWTPPTPQRVKGCTPLTILKKKSKHKKASAAPVGAIALTLFSLLHKKPLSRCATAPPRGSERPPPAPRFRRKRRCKCRLPLRPHP